MSSIAIQPTIRKRLEDPLAHLPFSSIVEYRKGRAIYIPEHPPNNLYLVIEGKVKVSKLDEGGRQVVMDIYQCDEFFGESAFLGLRRRGEQAVALEDTRVMMWATSTLEEIVIRRPLLAVALLQVLVRRAIGFQDRIQSLSSDNTAQRLARTLIGLSMRLGTAEEDGSVQMGPLTHELLSQYVGTTREIITQHMNRFRRRGYLRYSRRGMVLYRDALREWLRLNPLTRPSRRGRPRTIGVHNITSNVISMDGVSMDTATDSI